MKPYKNECKHLKDGDCYLDRSEAAVRYRRSEKTLANWSSLGCGPPFVSICGKPLYRLCCLRTWDEYQRTAGEAAS